MNARERKKDEEKIEGDGKNKGSTIRNPRKRPGIKGAPQLLYIYFRREEDEIAELQALLERTISKCFVASLNFHKEKWQ